MSVIDASTDTVAATISNPAARTPLDIITSPDGSRLYTANFNSSNVSVINAATNTILALIPTGGGTGSVAITPDGLRVFTANENANNVSVIDTATDAVIGTIPVGATPTGIIISNGFAYVTNGAADSMSVIDTATDTVVDTLPVGATPIALATAPTVAPPTVTGVSPTHGPSAGGTTVTISGSHLTGATAVDFGGTAATGVSVVDDSTVTAVAPAGTPGTVDVTKEPATALWTLPLQQVVYRQLMYLVVIHSVVTAVVGARLRWQRMDRHGSLSVPAQPSGSR